MPIEGGEAREIVAFAGIANLDVSRDSRRLLFSDLRPAEPGQVHGLRPPELRQRTAYPRYACECRNQARRFTTDDSAIAYVDNSGTNIWAQPIADGPPRPDYAFHGSQGSSSFACADGKRLAVVRATTTNDIVLLKSSNK